MNVRLVEEKEKKIWEDFVLEHPFSVAWQSYDWSQVVKRHHPVEFHPLAAFDNGKINGILPLYYIKTSLTGPILISVPYAVAGGALADEPEVLTALVSEAVRLAGKSGSKRITFKQYRRPIACDGTPLSTDDNFHNRELDLAQGTDQIWQGLAEFNKVRIEESERFNPVLEFPSPEIGSFYGLLLRHQHKRGIPCVSRGWIEDLIRFKMYSIALLRVGRKIKAGTLVKEFKKTISFPFTCIDDSEGPGEAYACSLYWKLIQHFVENQYEICHSGRIPNTEETDHYRLGWGGARQGYFYQYYPASTENTEFKTKRGGKRKLIESIWKKTPVSLARLAGPLVVRQFP